MLRDLAELRAWAPEPAPKTDSRATVLRALSVVRSADGSVRIDAPAEFAATLLDFLESFAAASGA